MLKCALCRNHARQKTKKGDWYWITMGLRALTASSGSARWSIAVGCSFWQRKRKNPTAQQGSRELALLYQ
jgi:hypothetical protein